MSGYPLSPQKQEALRRRMAELGILESDLEEHFVRGSGRGGQKINKTSSCVRLRHKPSGLEVRCERERSQAMNRYWARRELCDKLEERMRGILSARRQAMEKIRRQKRKRSKRAKEKVLRDKAYRAALKKQRSKVREQD